MLPIINPVGTTVLLLGIGAHLDPASRERQVRKACIYASGLVISFLGFRMLFPDAIPVMSTEALAEARTKADILLHA